MKNLKSDLSKNINHDELSLIINNAYECKNDIYNIEDNFLSLYNDESALTLTFNSDSELLNLLKSFFINEVYYNELYDNLLLIYNNYEIIENEYLLDKKHTNDEKIIIMSNSSHIIDIVKKFLNILGYKEIAISKKKHLKLMHR